MSAQQQKSSFPLQKQDALPFFTSLSISLPGNLHAHRAFVSKDNIALSSNVGILETAASVPATSPLKISVWGDLAELKTLKGV